MTRDVAPRLGYLKPGLIHSKFVPGLKGLKAKMSASDPNSAIYVTDSAKDIQTKINKYAFSGGRATLEEHRRLGGDVKVDVACQYLSFFCDDDEKIAKIFLEYSEGKLLSSQVKEELTKFMVPFIGGIQQARTRVTDAVVLEFMKPRKLNFGGK